MAIFIGRALYACATKRNFCGPFSARTRTMCSLHGEPDRHHGVHLSLNQLTSTCSPADFHNILTDSMKEWQRQDYSSVWIRVPISHSHLISTASQFGFTFHHAEGNESTLHQWLHQGQSRVHRFATHQVGVAGCVVREDRRQVLVVQDKHSLYPLWKFPGGVSELGEDIGETAEREILEETGVVTKFQGVLAFRQQHKHPNAHGRSDFFFLCHMKPLSEELIPCPYEVAKCEWMDFEEIEKHMQTSVITRRSMQLLEHGMSHGFDSVTLRCDQFRSVYKGLVFNMYHPHVEGADHFEEFIQDVTKTQDDD